MSGCCSAMGCLCSDATSEGATSEGATSEGAPSEGAPSEASDEVGGCRRTLLAGGGERIEGWTIVDMVRGTTGVRLTLLMDYRKV